MNRSPSFIRILSGIFVMVILLLMPSRAQVVINEIMYRPGTGFPENTGMEFIELHNPTAAAVPMDGWSITSGVAFTFPAGASVPAGGYIVVAANPTAVQNAYGISGVFGPWVVGTGLANSGEKITVSKPGTVVGTFDKVDSVTYASEGDWATRVVEPTFSGWDWSTGANGGNKSLELRNPVISNDNGQNWSPSTAPAGASPAGPNSVLTTNVPPIIHGVKHFPAVPKSTEAVTISCEVTDEAAPQFLAATLFWRTGTGAFQTAPMTLNTLTGRFSATLAAQVNLTIVEFYVSVTDGVSTRTWPAPANGGQNANCQYQVTNELLSPNEAYYWLVLTAAENTSFTNVSSSSDRQFNTTLIVTTGADTTIRYRSSMRIRGNSSRGYQFKPLRITMPNDEPWDGSSNFNLNPKASFLQFMGMRLFQAAGVRAPDSIPVKPRRNGVEYTTSSGITPDYGRWVREEDVNGDMVARHWPEAKGGGIYKKGRPDQYWRNTGWTVPTNPNGSIDGWLKQNNSAANDWTDLTGFFATAQAVTAPHFPGAAADNSAGATGSSLSGIGNWDGTAFSAPEMATLDTVADLDQWARWFAVMTILQDFETNISNGQDDDYGIYFAPNALGQRRANFVVHDMDTIFGMGDATAGFNSTGLFDMTDNGSVFRPLLPLLGNNTIAGNVVFRQKYFDALRELFGSVFDADNSVNPNPPFYQFVDSHLGGWAPEARLTAIKDFVRLRREYLLDLIPDGIVGGAVATPITPPAGTSTATLASTHGDLMISEILADNVSAVNVGGLYPDIIEIFNGGGGSVDLSGMSLSDDPAAKTKFVFPPGTVISSGNYLVVYADSGTGAGLHAGFALDSDGDSLHLYGTVASGQALLDSIAFGLQPPDYSIGRTGAALDTWALCTPTIGGPNSQVVTLASPSGLRINEWAGNGDYVLDEDFIEVFNPAAQPVALGGMRLTDDFINYPSKVTIPVLSFASPGSFIRFRARGGSATTGNASELKFSIDANFGWLALIGQNGSIVDSVDVVAQPADTSRGRTPNGSAIVTTFGLPSTLPTPGASNVAPPANVLALINGLRISELLYKPNNLEFIELHNISGATLDLAGVRFVKGVTYTFPSPTTLAAGAYLVVCKDRVAFQAQYGTGVVLAPGVFTGTLDNAGENITLQPPAPWDVNILNFSYSSAWFADTNNDYSLTVIDDLATAPRDWGDKATWSPSPAPLGTPGAASPPTITSPLTTEGEGAVAFSYQIAATKNPTSFNAAPLPGGLSVNTTTGLVTGTPTVSGVFNISISATNSAGTGTRTLVLTIITPPPPTITSAGTASGNVATAFTYQIVATRNPTSYSAPGLPAGLSLNTATGLISGSPTVAGTFDINLGATNGFGTGNKTLTLTIAPQPPPVITSAGSATTVVNSPFNYQIIATNSPTSYGATGLPAGLAVNSSTGLINGTPTVQGTFNITLSAANLGGTGTKALTLIVGTSGPIASLIWSTIPTPQQAGVPFPVTITARDAQGLTVTSFNSPVTISGTAGRPPAITGTGAGTWNYPLSTFYHDARTQSIYLQSEIGAAGRITSLALDVTTVPGQAMNACTIRLKHTALASYASNAWENTGWTTVYSAATTISTTGLATFTFTTPFDYNGTSNLMVDFSFNNTFYTDDGYVRVSATTANRSIYYRTDSNFGDPLTWNGTSSPSASAVLQVPNLKLTFQSGSASITPSSVSGFVNGVWTGNIAVNQVAVSLPLIANDGAGHIAASNTFNVVLPPAPVVTSPATALAVVGQPFSYQILGTNYIASYNATGRPAGINVNTATGLISGTPTTAGTTTVTVSATNLGGTGSLALSLQVQADADGDGMGDAWETANGLNPGLNDSAADLDGDGQSNISEWLSGTGPNNVASRFAVSTTQISGSNVVLTWASVIGRRYRVFSNTGLSSGTWVEITPAPIVATSATTSFTEVGGAGGSARFYRVSVQP